MENTEIIFQTFIVFLQSRPSLESVLDAQRSIELRKQLPTKMFLTTTLLKKVKSRKVMVLMESVVSGYKFTRIRPRLAEKAEVIAFDPYIQQDSVFKEKKRIRSM
ncbi:large ribosomal subunit protein bL33m [Penaeus vannamei]|uniref:large ribosomal subunit protein bL33m n=1 Tax=Penaeus vannamei TaxID=6689 RepID=UPI00387F8439